MSVCLHDTACPGHGYAHEAAMNRAGTPRVDLSDLAKLPPLPGRIELPGLTDEDRELRPSTRMLLAMAHTRRPIYQGTVPAHVKASRRRKNRAARRARAVHRRCTR